MNAKQHDSKSRFIRVTCFNCGQKVTLNPNDYSAYIRYRKPDGYGAFNSCIISTDGSLVFELTEQMLSTVGTACADLLVLDVVNPKINTDLTIISADGRIIENNASIASTMTFYINILEKPLNEWDVTSTNEFSALNDLLIKVNADYEYVMQNAQESADAAKEYAKNVERYATLSRSYALGDTNTRPNESTENAKYYYELCRKIAIDANIDAYPRAIVDAMIEGLQDNIIALKNEISSLRSAIKDSNFIVAT